MTNKVNFILNIKFLHNFLKRKLIQMGGSLKKFFYKGKRRSGKNASASFPTNRNTLFASRTTFFPDAPQPEKANQGVQQQNLKTEPIAPQPLLGMGVDNIGEYRSQQANRREILFLYFAAGRQSENKQSQNRPVSVAHRLKQGIDDTAVVQLPEQNNHQAHQDGKS